MIVSITVTFNSSHYLENVLKGLEKQTRKVDWIIIIDNNSNDKHRRNIHKIIENKENIIYLKMEKNIGGAGGFYKGVRYAKEKLNPDWYWLMDDDAIPAPDCLQTLLNYQGYSKNVGCLVPIVFGIDYKKYQLYHNKKIQGQTMWAYTACNKIERLDEVTQIDTCSFVGPLISKKAVDGIGFPDRTLFIYGDDTEYIYRIRQKFDVFLIKKAVMYHKDPPQTNVSEQWNGWWKEYYLYRNKIFFIDKYSKNNFGKKMGIALLKLYLILSFFKMFFSGKYKESRKYWKVRKYLIQRALKDGKRMQSGMTINPMIYYEYWNQKKKE